MLIPATTDIDQLIAHMRGTCFTPTEEELNAMLTAVGRANGPHLLASLHDLGLLTSENAVVVGSVWSMTDYPEDDLSPDVWRDLFAISGYTDDRVPCERPAGSVRLWRGAPQERRGGWSWTDDREVASTYASGYYRAYPAGIIWTAEVPTGQLLCHMSDRVESEYVVDTAGLEIVYDAKFRMTSTVRSAVHAPSGVWDPARAL